MGYQRTAKYTPWYHQAKPRCVTVTLAGDQCIFSASYESVGAQRITVCKTHADMIVADPDSKITLKPLTASKVWLR